MTMGDLYQRTLEKRRYLKSLGYIYLQMWESDFDRAVESTEEMKSFVENLEIISPLEPRDAFYGPKPLNYTPRQMKTPKSNISM